MGRPKSVNRNEVLDAAERIVSEEGAGALSIGSVASAAGISKGGVQSTFGTKEGLIVAILDRWIAEDERSFQAALVQTGSPPDPARAHLHTTRAADGSSQTRIASLLAVLVQSPEHLAGVRRWYAERLGRLQADTSAEKMIRIALLAAEGAFLIRFLGLHTIDEATWDGIFQDLDDLIAKGPRC